MEDEGFNLKAEFSAALGHYQPQRTKYYSAVTVLMLLWQDDDLGCLAEVKQFSASLQSHFGYKVQLFFIPSIRPEASLCRAISDFLYDYGSSGNLVLLFYAGHGDPDLGGERQAVWAALRTGGPTVRWHLIQPTVEAADCDVLIILDCCFAGQAARGRASHKIELLAAAAMGLRTPGVGQRYPSFTSVLMQEMEHLLYERKSFEVTALYQRLLKKELNLQQQPFYAPLAGLSIVLRKLKEGDDVIARSKTDNSPSICMDVTLFEHPSESQKDRILQWLTVMAPKDVSAIEVVNVYEKATSTVHLGQKLHDEISKETPMQPTFIPNPAKASLLQHFENLILAVDKPIPPLGPNEGFVIEIVGELKRKSQNFLESIEDCIASTTLEQLQNLAAVEESRTSSLADRIAMRLKLLEDVSPDTESYEEERVRFETSSKDKERLRKGRLGEMSVLVEYYYPNPNSGQYTDSNKILAESVMVQARKIAALHAEPKEEVFCTLDGRGMIQEHLHGFRLGFIYVIPQQYRNSTYVSLAACFRDRPIVPLEVRVKLAQKLATAVISLHSIGWLHKNIKNENVLVFCHCQTVDSEISPAGSSASLPVLENPFLLGFDCARPAAAESLLQVSWNMKDNLYRHPSRWGRPLKFTKAHDIYALGILLLEIAFWRPIYSLDPDKRSYSKVRDPEKLRDIFIEICKSKLAHTVGSRYASAVENCLTRDINDQKDDWHLQRYVRNQVLNNLRIA